MCLGIPGQIVEIHPADTDLATVDIGGVRRTIEVGLLADEPLTPGDWVLIHVGFALSRIDEAEAARELARLAEYGPGYDEERQAIVESRIT